MKIEKYSTEEIMDSINNETDKFAKKKLQAFLLITEGVSPDKVAKKVSRKLSTIYSWIKQIREEGLEHLKIKPGRGRKFLLTEKQFQELKVILSKPIKTQDGYSRGWQSKDVILHIKKKYSVTYSFSRIRELLRIIGFRKIVCRPKSKRRNEKLTQEFLNKVKKKVICWERNTL